MLLNKTFTRIVKFQVSSSILLIIAAILAIIIANSPLNNLYQSLWNHKISFEIGEFNLLSHVGHSITIKEFISDALMAVFFFVVGLEIKREIMVGELSSLKKAMLPVVAACGGMIVPVLIFFFMTQGTAAEKGLAIPMATDISHG